MQIIDYSKTKTKAATSSHNDGSLFLESLTAAMIFLLPALILFIFAAS